MKTTSTRQSWPTRIRRLAAGVGLAATLCAAPAMADDESTQTLLLRGGDRIHGNLGAVDAKRLEWHRDDLAAPVRFDLESVRRIIAEPQNALPDGALRVRLTNGDDIPCTIQSMDDKTMVVKTAYADVVSIPRGLVKNVQMGNARKDTGLFAKLTDLTGFRPSGNWEMKNGRLTGQGGIIYQSAMPDRAYVSVDVEWTADKPDFSVITHANNSSYYHYGYNAYVNGNMMTMSRGTRSVFPGAHTFELPATKKMTMELMVDRAKGEVEVYVNRRKVGKWETSYDSRQSYLAFAVNGNQQVTFSNLHIEPLDDERRTAENETEHDQVGFGDSDRLTGRITGIADGTLALTTTYGDLKIPMDQVTEVIFAHTKLKARLEANDVQVHLPAGAIITLAMTGIEDGHIVGTSENYGELKLDLAFVSRIDFHIYDAPDDNDEVGATDNGRDNMAPGSREIFEALDRAEVQIQIDQVIQNNDLAPAPRVRAAVAIQAMQRAEAEQAVEAKVQAANEVQRVRAIIVIPEPAQRAEAAEAKVQEANEVQRVRAVIVQPEPAQPVQPAQPAVPLVPGPTDMPSFRR